MLLPGTDPITMLISMLPLVLLFEFSLIVARIANRRRDAADSASTTLAAQDS
jgi:Sec-independent protein secretion pathway component TatC